MKTKTDIDFDTLTLYIKKARASKIIDNYKTFGWELVNEKENNQYEDILDITLKRPHKIENKDELQLMQVYLEDKLNSLAKLEKNKHPKSTSFGLIFGVFGTFLILLGALFGFKVLAGASLPISIFLSFIGIFFLLLTLIFIPKIYSKELKDYNQKHLMLEKDTKDICKKASELWGEKNE